MNGHFRDDLAIVLVEPQIPGNIGMVCRAMANFGVGDLRLVNPCQHLHPEAAKFAVFAKDLLGGARVFGTLAEALADLRTAVAFTRRSGRLRGDPRPVAAIPGLLQNLPADGMLGLVFGREDAGLTSEEVALCPHTAFIPSRPDTGSLNLAQAVVVALYEFSRTADAAPCSAEIAAPSQGEMEDLFRRMETVLARIAFLNPASPEGGMGRLRRIFRRAAPSREELGLLRGMWDQIAWSARDWRGRKRGEG
jgi:tRNA/rRNA methyltransferase